MEAKDYIELLKNRITFLQEAKQNVLNSLSDQQIIDMIKECEKFEDLSQCTLLFNVCLDMAKKMNYSNLILKEEASSMMKIVLHDSKEHLIKRILNKNNITK